MFVSSRSDKRLIVHDFGSDRLRARVKAHGAELCSLAADGTELLWQAGPAWPRHAPVLFPIVGRLAHDALHHDGHTTRLTQHGFARDRMFRLLEADASSCRWVLEDDEATRAMFPFPFRLTLAYAVSGATLTTTYSIENAGAAVLPASLGTHTAFAWPLVNGIDKAAHRLVFEAAETGPAWRLDDGLLLPDPVPSPVAGNTLALSDALFAQDAVILRHPASRRVRYEAPGAAHAIEVGWDGFTDLGIWSKPADFLCIEPWSGHASPVGFDGEFRDKPGVMLIEPGDAVVRMLTVRIVAGPG